MRNVRVRVILLGVAAVTLSVLFSLALELLISRRESERIAHQEFVQGTTELAPAVSALWADPDGPRLLRALFARLPAGEDVFLLSRDGRVLVSSLSQPEGSTSGIPYPLPPDMAKLLAAHGPPVVRSVPARGGALTELFVPLPGRLELLAVHSPQLAAGLERQLFSRSLPLLLVGVGLLTIILWFGLRRILLQPLQLMAESSRRVMAGEDETLALIPAGLIPSDEIGEVMRLFNRMLQKLHSARLETEEELHRSTFQLELAHRLSDRLDSHVGYQELFQEVLVRAREVVPWDVGAGLILEAGQARVWARARGPVAAAAAAAVEHWLAEACTAETGRRLLPELWREVRWMLDGQQPVAALRAHLAVPVRSREGVAALVVLGRVEAESYTAYQTRLLAEVLEHGVAAVERVRALASVHGRQLELALDASGIGIVLLDARGRVDVLNRKADEYLALLEGGSSRGSRRGRAPRFLEAVPPQGVLQVQAPEAPQQVFRVHVAPAGTDGRVVVIEQEDKD